MKVQLSTSHWSPVRSAPLLEVTFGDMLRRLAHEVPDRIGFVEAPPPPRPTRRWTYLELLHEAERAARALLRVFQPGERIAVWAPNCAEWVLLQHALALAGLVLVTVNPAYLAEEVCHVLSTSEASGIFHASSNRGIDMTAIVAELRNRLPMLRHAYELSQWESFTSTSDPRISLPTVMPLDTIQIQFTSGTTGRPKGAQLHHLGLINASHFAAQRAMFPDGGIWATAMPLFHVGGSAGSHYGAMSSRGTFVLQPSFDAGDMLRIVETEQVQHIHGVPTMIMRMLEHPDRPKRNLKSLKTIQSGGSLVPESLVLQARDELNCRFTINYGQTELNGVVCQTFPDDSVGRQIRTIGQPSLHAELKITDPTTGATRPLNEPGEIWVRGYQVMHGYFNPPAAADTSNTNDGWLRTGDIATMDPHGYLTIVGRLKDCIIRGGENIYPREIEDVLHQHPCVLEAAVVGAPDLQWGEVVAAFIKLRSEVPVPQADQLYKHCRDHLAAYKAPVRWYYVDTMPTTSSGKVQKFALRNFIMEGSVLPQPFVKPEIRNSKA